MKHLLALDIGNTNIVAGVYDGEQLVAHWRAATDAQKTADEYAVLLASFFTQRGLQLSQIGSCIMACVVPPLVTPFADLARRYLGVEPLIVGTGIKVGVRILTDNPREVGADRVVNALAARKLYGLPAIVIDFGTATTFDAVSVEGDYLGGAIAPGIGIAAEALFQRAAQLPRIDLLFPPRAIGKNTVHSMQSGVLYGYVAMVEGLTKRIKAELGGEAKVIATGGLAELVASKTEVIEFVDQNLTIEGLRLIYEMNQ
ncbi:MAG: type III pantothenate kinase [Anaerolineae bacterium]